MTRSAAESPRRDSVSTRTRTLSPPSSASLDSKQGAYLSVSNLLVVCCLLVVGLSVVPCLSLPRCAVLLFLVWLARRKSRSSSSGGWRPGAIVGVTIVHVNRHCPHHEAADLVAAEVDKFMSSLTAPNAFSPEVSGGSHACSCRVVAADVARALLACRRSVQQPLASGAAREGHAQTKGGRAGIGIPSIDPPSDTSDRGRGETHRRSKLPVLSQARE